MGKKAGRAKHKVLKTKDASIIICRSSAFLVFLRFRIGIDKQKIKSQQ
jgi:hypothetical protein